MMDIFPRQSPLECILTADLAKMYTSNQHNGLVGKNLHHKSTGAKGEVAALEHRVAHILSHGETEEYLLCEYWKN